MGKPIKSLEEIHGDNVHCSHNINQSDYFVIDYLVCKAQFSLGESMQTLANPLLHTPCDSS